MTLKPGKTLLHYRLSEKIGEGGMGVVWKAVDTTLNREVAIKVLPAGFAGEAERLARFEREAKLLASLNHPNIAGIYGIHRDENLTFLAMELIDGEDLQQRMSRGALSPGQALKIGLQIAQAFEVAHESGVIHRDLKPANVKLTGSGQVKVLDFGLAKALAQDPSDPASPSLSPTLTSAGTVAGTLLGTASYMSPEQAKGKPVDRRADIWSFGVVMCEMLSGRRLFEGETISETLAAVIMKDVDFDGLPANTPKSIRRLLERCLERDPGSRLRDIGEARIRLEEAIASPEKAERAEAVTRERRGGALAVLPWVVAVAALAALGWSWLRPAPTTDTPPVMRFTMALADDQPLDTSPIPMLALSPDGKRIAYVGTDAGKDVIYLRHSHQQEATPLKGTTGAAYPFFSPDGEWIGFEAGGKLKKISVLGGPPSTLCDAPRLRGASWGTDGTIVFSPDRAGGIRSVSEAGGEPEVLTRIDAKEGLGAPSDRWPDLLPDNRTVIFVSTEANNLYDDAEIVAFSREDKSRKTLVKGGTFARYVPPGFLVYARDDTLFAARFDPDAVELTGPAVPVLEGVSGASNYGSKQLAISDNGTLLYLGGGSFSDDENLVWLDRNGKEEPASAHVLDFLRAELSPDGKQVALAVATEGDSSFDLWILELARDTLTRLTFGDTQDGAPIWTPDGKWLTYFSDGGEGGSVNLFRRRADGTGEAERLTTSENSQRPQSWSPDGKLLVFFEENEGTGGDLMFYRPGADPEVEVFLQTPFDEWLPQISPDGRFILYASNQSGRPEIYVRSLTGGGQQVRVSTDGSAIARWSADGNELIYRNLEGKVMAVRFTVENGAFVPALPEELFETLTPPYSFMFQPVPGGRILTYRNELGDQAERREPVVVINWTAELEAKVPKK